MLIFKDLQDTFTASFGRSRTGKTVAVTILDADGSNKGSGFTLGSVVELTDGYYSIKITFTEAFQGFIKWANSTDGIELYQPINIINDYRDDITTIEKIETNRWKVTGNQLILYDDDETTPLFTFDLKKGGVANDGTDPDERIIA